MIAIVRQLKRFVGRQTGILSILERLERQQQALEQLRQTLDQLRQMQSGLDQQLRAVDTLKRHLRPFAGLSLPVYLDDALRPLVVRDVGASPHRVIVCSIPKSGTYLVAKLLELLGVRTTMLHVWSNGLSDYRNKTIEQMRRDYLDFTVSLPLEQSLKLIRSGQFTVGHLECNESTRLLLDSFKKIFVYRNLRDASISWMRFFADTGRTAGADDAWKTLPDGPARMLAFCDTLGPQFFALCHTDWLKTPGVLSLSFEELYGDHGTAVQHAAIRNLHRHLEISTPLAEPAHLVSELIGKPTLTWSGSRTRREDYWNDAVEEKFRELGGCRLNSALGYDESAAGPAWRAAA